MPARAGRQAALHQNEAKPECGHFDSANLLDRAALTHWPNWACKLNWNLNNKIGNNFKIDINFLPPDDQTDRWTPSPSFSAKGWFVRLPVVHRRQVDRIYLAVGMGVSWRRRQQSVCRDSQLSVQVEPVCHSFYRARVWVVAARANPFLQRQADRAQCPVPSVVGHFPCGALGSVQ